MDDYVMLYDDAWGGGGEREQKKRNKKKEKKKKKKRKKKKKKPYFPLGANRFEFFKKTDPLFYWLLMRLLLRLNL